MVIITEKRKNRKRRVVYRVYRKPSHYKRDIWKHFYTSDCLKSVFNYLDNIHKSGHYTVWSEDFYKIEKVIETEEVINANDEVLVMKIKHGI